MNLDHLTRLPLKVNLNLESSIDEYEGVESSHDSSFRMKSPTKKVRNEMPSGDRSKQPGSSLLHIIDSEQDSPKPSFGAVKELAKSVDLSPFKHLDLDGPL